MKIVLIALFISILVQTAIGSIPKELNNAEGYRSWHAIEQRIYNLPVSTLCTQDIVDLAFMTSIQLTFFSGDYANKRRLPNYIWRKCGGQSKARW